MKDREFDFLITTTTLSSSNLMKQKLFRDKNIIHRFLPIDKLSLVKKFLDEWSPNLIFFVDSEIWPNYLIEAGLRRGTAAPRFLAGLAGLERSGGGKPQRPSGYRRRLIPEPVGSRE